MHPLLRILMLPLALAPALHADDRFEAPPVAYSATTPADAITQLQGRLAEGAIRLVPDPAFGYLRSLLETLDIPLSSQVLVFSKTSFQADAISPATPRAIYFNDDTYVGTVQRGEVLEISTADPNLGAVFYTLDQHTPQPRFQRRTQECLQCHASTMTRNFPGHLVRSVTPDAAGFPILRLGTHLTTQESPLGERWGGWYVTGTHGAARHMGNVVAQGAEEESILDLAQGANVTSLASRIDTSQYLTPDSDIVALMVLEHQVQMHNLITQANFEARWALKDQAALEGVESIPPDRFSESTRRRIAHAGDRLVRHMLFVNELELKDLIRGTSTFAQDFESRGPFDSQGRSLREFDLESRIFRYPLSYLIYSREFDGLPEPMREYVYRQLFDILTGKIATRDYLHLTNAVSRAIREILVETKADLPEHWK